MRCIATVQRCPLSVFFLIYEVLLDNGEPRLLVSVKSDFDPAHEMVQRLGVIGPASFEDLQQRALRTSWGSRQYSFFGSGYQHFATEFAACLGASDRVELRPARTVSTTGVVVGMTAAIGSASAAGAALLQPSAPFAPLVIKSVAVSTTSMGIVVSVSLLGIVVGYYSLQNVSSEQPEGNRSDACIQQSPMLLPIVHRSTAGKPGDVSAQSEPLAAPTEEPESEAVPACDQEPQTLQRTSLCTTVSEEPEAEDVEDAPQEGRKTGPTPRAAPWCSGTSWEQPPWMHGDL